MPKPTTRKKRPRKSTAARRKGRAASVPKEWPAAKTETRATGSLVPYARNARTHSKSQIAKIAASIREWGWTNPVLIDEDNGIIAGHGRVLAAELLEIEAVPVLVARGWSKAQRQAYVLADNRLALDAGWDNELLSLELGELGELGFDLELTGFDDDEIGTLVSSHTRHEQEEEEDPLPEVPAVAVSKLGDVWILGQHRLVCGDSSDADVLGQALDGRLAASVVTDPPYGLEFMGKEWDSFRTDDPKASRWTGKHAGEQGRAKEKREGAFGKVAYGGGKRSSTYRCRGCGKRDQFRNPHESCGEGDWKREAIDPYAAPPTSLAFQEWVRQWSLTIMRFMPPGAHMLVFGGTRMFHRLTCAIEDAGFEIRDCLSWLYGSGFPKSLDVSKAIDKAAGVKREVVGQRGHSPSPGAMFAPGEYEGLGTLDRTAPATEAARRFDGYGTSLKPAWEPIVLAMKPLDGTFAENAQAHGVAGLNVDGGRIEGVKPQVTQGVNTGGTSYKIAKERRTSGDPNEGRWPANVALDTDAAAVLDEQSGTLTSGQPAGNRHARGVFSRNATETELTGFGDSGGASRFFYTAKASRADRGEGNDHPTVKPTALIEWLLRLTMPPASDQTDGVVLEPFSGSGTTIIAAERVGRPVAAIELDPRYVDVAVRRWQNLTGLQAKHAATGRTFDAAAKPKRKRKASKKKSKR